MLPSPWKFYSECLVSLRWEMQQVDIDCYFETTSSGRGQKFRLRRSTTLGNGVAPRQTRNQCQQAERGQQVRRKRKLPVVIHLLPARPLGLPQSRRLWRWILYSQRLVKLFRRGDDDAAE